MISPNEATRLFIFKRLFLTALLLITSVIGADALGNATASTLREKDLRKSESILDQLRRLEKSTSDIIDLSHYRTLFNKMYPGLFVKVAELKDSDLKTDLTTAIFLYEQAFLELGNSAERKFKCEDERRSVYARICLENRSDSLAKFLLAKARLHTLWADSTVKYQRGAATSQTLAVLEEIRRERRYDLDLAERAVAVLKTLGEKVYAYSSLAEFEERGTIARVSFERFANEATHVLASVDRILQSLPRGPLFYSLYHARNSYDDGLFWWQKTYRRKKLVVNVNSMNTPDEIKTLELDPGVTNYTVAINLRKAVEQTRRAEGVIQAAKIR
jgi:hypothetical protein